MGAMLDRKLSGVLGLLAQEARGTPVGRAAVAECWGFGPRIAAPAARFAEVPERRL